MAENKDLNEDFKVETKNIDIFNSSSLVLKSNALMQARIAWPMNAQKIFLLIAASSDMLTGENKNVWTLPVNILEEQIGVKRFNSTYLKELATIMLDHKIEIQHQDEVLNEENWKFIRFFQEASYEKGEIRFVLTDICKTHIVDLKQNYSKFGLEQVLKLKSQFSIRLYEIIFSIVWQRNGYLRIDVEELRKKLGVSDGSYARFSDFEGKVLRPACKEVNEITDIEIRYDKIKKGRNIEYIDFLFKKKNTTDKFNLEDYLNLELKMGIDFNYKDLIKSCGIKEKTWTESYIKEIFYLSLKQMKKKDKAFEILKNFMATKDIVYRYIQKNYEYSKLNSKLNLEAYFEKAIEEDYAGMLSEDIFINM